MNSIKRVLNWLESGDLVPALIAVSVFHYTSVLSRFDSWPVAAAVGCQRTHGAALGQDFAQW